MVELMISLEVLAKGCQTLDEMRVLVKEKMARHNNWRMVNEVRLFYVAQPEVVTK